MALRHIKIDITSANGDYGRESQQDRWWYWVKDRIVFTLDDPGAARSAIRRHLSVEYWVDGDRKVTLSIIGKGDRLNVDLPSPPGGWGLFDLVLPGELGPLDQVILAGEGTPTQIAPTDDRIVRFLVGNLEVRIESQDGGSGQ